VINIVCSRPSVKPVGFPPLRNEFPRIIILGSMPGTESLKKRQYYGHPRNQFWAIVQGLLGQERTDDYKDKKRMLYDHHIVLWDVVHSCRRKGSLDANMRDVKINDLKQLLLECSSVRAVFCNGQTAFKLFKRYHRDVDLPVFPLPSTSPAYTLPFRKKMARWRRILKFIR
jgi:hypoxanthine-DNA glycosylase